jgi:hypothetical protein
MNNMLKHLHHADMAIISSRGKELALDYLKSAV